MSKGKQSYRVLGLVLLMAAIFVLPINATAKSPKEIKVGFMFGLTGGASPVGPVQRDGAKLAIKEINDAGGVKIGEGKVPVTYVIKDDETKPDIAIRRLRELVKGEKVDVVVGQTFASISAAINKQVKKMKIAYFPVNVVAVTMFNKTEMADSTMAVHGCAYSIGYAGASYIVNNLGHKKVTFFGPAYAFGTDQWEGAKAAFENFGVKANYIESPVGTSDYTSYLLKIAEEKPDIVMMAHWGTDAINVLKQSYETGLKKKTNIWFNWMTNVFGAGVPAGALEGVYSLMSWYWDMGSFKDAEIVSDAKSFSAKFMNEYGYAPDPYSAMAYTGTKEALRGIELAQSTDPDAIAQALLKNPEFQSMKGVAKWRADHQPIYKYGAFVVKGKGEAEREGKWDLVSVIGAYTGEDYLPPLKDLGY